MEDVFPVLPTDLVTDWLLGFCKETNLERFYLALYNIVTQSNVPLGRFYQAFTTLSVEPVDVNEI